MVCRRRIPMFRHRHFSDEIILLCVRWYVSYKLSYRDLAEMMLERGIRVAPSTIYRRVQRYMPEFEKRWNRFSRPVGTTWRVDETYVNIKGKWNYLYRAVDKQGRTVDFYLSRNRSFAAAQAFFRKALATHSGHGPRKVTLDGYKPSHEALRMLRCEHETWRRVKVRCSQYLNNIVEQDHRAIKSRCRAMKCLQPFNTATVTISGIELAHRIRKRQFIGLNRDRSQPINLSRAPGSQR